MSQDLILARWFDWDMPAAAAPAGPITGSAGLTFSQSGTLQGLTQLTGTAGLTFGQSATAQGLTALTGSNGLTFSQTGTLSGNSALIGTAQITLGQSGSATGNTALTGTAQITFGQSGTLDPLSGDISGTAGITFGQSAALQGLTALTGTGALTFAASGTLDQPGAVTGTAGLTLSASGTLQGLTALTGTASITFSGSANADQPAGSGSSGPTPAGGSVRSRLKRRMYVEIDGQSFPVDGSEHAKALLERARDIAASHAREIAEKIAPTRRKVGRKPIPLPTPKISSPDVELTEIISATRNAINDLYRSAAIEAEIAYLMHKAMEDDEDDALMLLM